MILILDGNSEIGAPVRSDYLICLRHLFRSRAVTYHNIYPKRPIFLHNFATRPELPSNISIMAGSTDEEKERRKLERQRENHSRKI